MIYSAIQCLAFCTGSNYIKVFNFAFISNMNHVCCQNTETVNVKSAGEEKELKDGKQAGERNQKDRARRQSLPAGKVCTNMQFKGSLLSQ